MKKEEFIKQFKNNTLISDVELLSDLLDTAGQVVIAKFGVSNKTNTDAILRTANLILDLESMFEEEKE